MANTEALANKYDGLIFCLEIIICVIAALPVIFPSNPIAYGRYSKTGKSTPTLLGKGVFWNCFAIAKITIFIGVWTLTPCPWATNPGNILAISCFVTHYIYKTVVYPRLYRKNESPIPVIAGIAMVTTCSLNGVLQLVHLLNVHRIDSFGVSGAIGLTLFGIGSAINIYHDKLLSKLRDRPSYDGKPCAYEIPKGGLFEYVSGANFFGEIVEWWGFALLTGGLPQVIFGCLSTCFIGTRAYEHHQFYLRTFGKAYPPQRKALIPYIL